MFITFFIATTTNNVNSACINNKRTRKCYEFTTRTHFNSKARAATTISAITKTTDANSENYNKPAATGSPSNCITTETTNHYNAATTYSTNNPSSATCSTATTTNAAKRCCNSSEYWLYSRIINENSIMFLPEWTFLESPRSFQKS